jgi:hypothetical protein
VKRREGKLREFARAIRATILYMHSRVINTLPAPEVTEGNGGTVCDPARPGDGVYIDLYPFSRNGIVSCWFVVFTEGGRSNGEQKKPVYG